MDNRLDNFAGTGPRHTVQARKINFKDLENKPCEVGEERTVVI